MVYEPQKYFRAEGRGILNAGEFGGRRREVANGLLGTSGHVEGQAPTGRDYVRNVSGLRSEPIDDTFRTYRRYVPNLSPIRSEVGVDTFRTY